MSEEYGTERVYGVTRVHEYAREQETHRHGGGHKAYEQAQAVSHEEVADVAEVLGVPADKLTPEVLAALSTLIEEVERLRWQDQQHKRREAFLEQQSDRHSVVPVLNRRAFLRELDIFLSGPEPHGSLVLLHAGGIEEVGRIHGLAAADGALRHVCSNVLGALRKTDLVGLVGGADFALLLPGGDRAQAREKAAEIAERTNVQAFGWLGQGIPFEMSWGIHLLAPGEIGEAVVAAADRERRGLDA